MFSERDFWTYKKNTRKTKRLTGILCVNCDDAFASKSSNRSYSCLIYSIMPSFSICNYGNEDLLFRIALQT